MLNWVKFFTVFLLALTTVIVITITYNANKPISLAKESAIEMALESKQIIMADNAQPYNGVNSIVTVFGEGANGEKKAIFIDETEEGAFKEVELTSGVTAETALKTVTSELEVTKVLHVSLGLEEVGPVWEVAFKNETGKLNYVYVLFENGQWWKRILNL